MAKRRWFAFFLLVFAGCARVRGCASELFSADGGWSIDRIEERWNTPEEKEDLITFRNGKTWNNLGMKAEKIAEISGPEGSRAIAFQAQSCVECEPDVLLTIRSTAGENFVAEPFPGKLTYVAMESGIRDSRPSLVVHAFFGKCLDENRTEVFIVGSTSVMDEKSVIKVFTPTDKGIETRRIESLPRATRGGLTGECREIPPLDRDVDG